MRKVDCTWLRRASYREDALSAAKELEQLLATIEEVVDVDFSTIAGGCHAVLRVMHLI